jgi:hypothetical protein
VVEIEDGDEQQLDRRSRDRWHVGREIPLTMLAGLIIQTGAAFWWASKLEAKIDSAIITIAEFKAERYTRDDARRDKEITLTLIDSLRGRTSEVERRLLAHEERDARELWKHM